MAQDQDNGQQKPHKGFLEKHWGKVAGVTVGSLLLGGLSIFSGMIFEYGMIHSQGWVDSGLAAYSTELFSPIAGNLPGFMASGLGQGVMEILEFIGRSAHRLMGITDTFQPPVLDAQNLGSINGGGDVILPDLFGLD